MKLMKNSYRFTTLGWGLTSPGGSLSEQLRFLKQITITNGDCRHRQPAEYIPLVYDYSLCTFSPQGSGTCSCDSGGPLVSNGTVIGIVSWGAGCATGLPDVYTRISYYYSWIMNEIDKEKEMNN